MKEELEILYPNGKMTIVLDTFLACGVAKFRQLLKIIESSYKPDEHIKILELYIKNYLEYVNPKLDELRDKLFHNEYFVKVAQDEVDRLYIELARLKEVTKRTMKNGKRAKAELTILREEKTECQNKLKDLKENMRHHKAVCSGIKSDIKKIERTENLYKKYMEILESR